MAKARGDCYEAAALYMLEHRDDPNLRLVHGEVAGQGPLEGMTLGHGWVEDGDIVIDKSNGRDICMPKELYYLIGKIHRINNIHSYGFEEMRMLILAHKHYGPWELETAQ
jgi:hypothetical protein